MVGNAGKQLIDGPEVKQLQFFGALQQTLDPVRRERRRKVEQGAGERGNRDLILFAAIAMVQAGVVESNSRLRVASGGRGDVDPFRCVLQQPPEPAGGGVTGVGRGTGQDRGEAMAMPVQAPTAHRVHTAVQPMQAPRRRRIRHGVV
jgi:hypothetical protein